MPIGEYYQEYGPIRRRRGSEEPQPPAGEPPSRPPRSSRRRRPRRRPPRQPLSLWRVLVRTVLLLLAMLLLLPYGVSLFYHGRALPGVRVQGRPVENLSREELEAVLAQQYAGFVRRPVRLTYLEQSWDPSLAELGVQFETSHLVETALESGRQGGPVARLAVLWDLWHNGRELTPRLVIDWHYLQHFLLDLSPAVETPPRNGSLSIAGGRVLATPARHGTQMLADETVIEIILAFRQLVPQAVAIRTRPLAPLIGNKALDAAVAEAQDFLTSTLVLTHTTGTWHWEQDKLSELLVVEPAGSRLDVRVDPGRLTRAVERLAQLVDTGTAEPRLRFEQGTLLIVEEGQTGWQLRQAETVRAISTTLHHDPAITRTVALSVEKTFPHITADSLDSLGIRELVSEGRSSFAGSAQYRITNIKAGAARLDGVLIAPGEEFSFNTQLGEVNEENGFVEGYAVVGNRTQLEWGGGVCQNSTTVFRAAFWAGLPITERHAHPFYISWYDRFAYGSEGNGPGMDATIFTGVSDLKFVNDTGHWLLMQTSVDEANQIFTVQLYGTRPDRQVVFDGPYISNEVQAPSQPLYINDPSRPAGSVYQSDVARNGRDIVIYRSIFKDGEEMRRDTFFTRFRAWPNVYVRGTGE